MDEEQILRFAEEGSMGVAQLLRYIEVLQKLKSASSGGTGVVLSHQEVSDIVEMLQTLRRAITG